MTEKAPRILFMMELPPSSLVAPSIVLKGLFWDYPARLSVLTTRWGISEAPERAEELRKRFDIHTGAWIKPRGSVVSRVLKALDYVLIPVIAAQAALLARRSGAKAIFSTCSVDLYFFLAASLASRLLGIPFLVYLMDDLEQHGCRGGIDAFMARRFAPRALARARQVWVVSPYLAESIQKIVPDPIVMPAPVDLSAFRDATNASHPDPGDKIRIVYAGGVGPFRTDGLRNLAKALETPLGERFRFILYTNDSPDYLRRMRLDLDTIEVRSTPLDGIPESLTAADILFLPQTFDPLMRQVVRTSPPSKLAEYLAAGVPILVNAPFDSALVKDARMGGYGLVVSEPDPKEVLKALMLLSEDRDLRAKLVERARSTVRATYDAAVTVPRFWQELAEATVHT